MRTDRCCIMPVVLAPSLAFELSPPTTTLFPGMYPPPIVRRRILLLPRSTLLFDREDSILGISLAKNRRMRGRLALMMASSGSRTDHSRPIGSVHVGSSKEIIMSD